MLLNNSNTAKPFLKWAGGKIKIIKELLQHLPSDISSRRYIEPFLGGGSLFFALAPKDAVLSDLNERLINCYKQVRDNPDIVYKHLCKFQKKHSKDFYYHIRNLYNNSKYSPLQAAQFIYLNKSAFNGIFRVNNNGEFNVPYNQKEEIKIPSYEQLMSASEVLKKVILKHNDYKDMLTLISRNDFLYIDPPYPPLNGTAYFTHYTKERFNDNDQESLAQFVFEANKIGAKILISNANTKKIRNLYRHWKKTTLSVRRWITCKKEKYLVEELIIKNY